VSVGARLVRLDDRVIGAVFGRTYPMPWRIGLVTAQIGGVVGAIVGFVLGLGYLPTLPFAIIEGALLIGVPFAVIGFLLTAMWALGAATRRRIG
jgi:hypothetical protein